MIEGYRRKQLWPGRTTTTKPGTNIAGDVTIEYQLSKDGRYKLKVYRINKYQVALQGQVVETGVAFVITLDYNEFKSYFKSQSKKRKQIK
jgi:hypothetical protein